MPAGALVQLKGGDSFSPWQVFFVGIRMRGLTSVKLGVTNVKADPDPCCAAAAPESSSSSELEQPHATVAKSSSTADSVTRARWRGIFGLPAVRRELGVACAPARRAVTAHVITTLVGWHGLYEPVPLAQTHDITLGEHRPYRQPWNGLEVELRRNADVRQV